MELQINEKTAKILKVENKQWWKKMMIKGENYKKTYWEIWSNTKHRSLDMYEDGLICQLEERYLRSQEK